MKTFHKVLDWADDYGIQRRSPINGFNFSVMKLMPNGLVQFPFFASSMTLNEFMKRKWCNAQTTTEIVIFHKKLILWDIWLCTKMKDFCVFPVKKNSKYSIIQYVYWISTIETETINYLFYFIKNEFNLQKKLFFL